MTKITQAKFRDFFTYFKGYEHQEKAVSALYDRVAKADPTILNTEERWAKLYSSKPTPKTEAHPTVNSPFTTYLTPNFQYGEVCLWQESRRFASQASLLTAIDLLKFCETCRAHFGCPIIITSGHRPEPINSQVGGAPNSEHTFYAAGVGALDIALERGNQFDLQDFVAKKWPYSVGFGAPSFVHVGMRGDGKKRTWHY